MTSIRLHRTLLLAAVACLWVTAGAWSQQDRSGLQSRVPAAGSPILTWTPGVEYERGVLVVTGKTVGAIVLDYGLGEPLQLDVGALPDGEYTYELLLFRMQTPDELAADGRTHVAGVEVEVQAHRHIGHFKLRDGLMDESSEGQAPSLAPLSLSLQGGGQIPVPHDSCTFDDLIVDGSACIGFDCGCNTENFGFDTFRLKENNLRLHFQDTSVAANFPSNDWRIRINDSSNSGASYFAIEDATGGRTPFLIEAGAPNDSLRVDSAGRIGIKTNNPVVEIHNADGDTPTLRFEQNGSSGFTPQTWDVAGNEAGFFVRDVTNGSKLSFRIQPNSPDKSIFIRTNGVAIRGPGTANNPLTVFGDADFTANVGIQEASPLSPLTVKGSGTNGEQLRLIFENDDNDIAVFGVDDSTNLFIQTHTVGTGSNSNIILQGGLPDGAVPGGNVGIGTSAPSERLHVAGNICATGTIAACSDKRFKKNIKTLTGALAKLARLRGVEFDWRRDEFPGHQFADQRQVGFIAQEINAVLPNVVNKGSDGYYSVDYGRLTPVLVEAVNELSATIKKKDADLARERRQIAQDRQRIRDLEAENASFRLRFERLEDLVGAATLARN